MLEEPKANAWETLGCGWRCSCMGGTGGSAPGLLYDYDTAYPAASAHANRNPTHRVQLVRTQERWVVPSAPEAKCVCSVDAEGVEPNLHHPKCPVAIQEERAP